MRCNRLLRRLRLKLQLLYAFQPSRFNLNSLFCHVNMFVAKMNYGLIILVINVNFSYAIMTIDIVNMIIP